DHEKTRFDFSHDKPLSPDQVEEVERIVNEQITQDRQVTPVVIPLTEAKKLPGVRAVFGEKYTDPLPGLLIVRGTPVDFTAGDSDGAGEAGRRDRGRFGRILRWDAPEPHRASRVVQDRVAGSGGQGRAARNRGHRQWGRCGRAEDVEGRWRVDRALPLLARR